MPLPKVEGKDYVNVLLFLLMLFFAFRSHVKEWREGRAAKKKLQDQLNAEQIEGSVAPLREAHDNLKRVNESQAARIAAMLIELEDKARLEKENARLEHELLTANREYFSLQGAFDEFDRRLHLLEQHRQGDSEKHPPRRRQ